MTFDAAQARRLVAEAQKFAQTVDEAQRAIRSLAQSGKLDWPLKLPMPVYVPCSLNGAHGEGAMFDTDLILATLRSDQANLVKSQIRLIEGLRQRGYSAWTRSMRDVHADPLTYTVAIYEVHISWSAPKTCLVPESAFEQFPTAQEMFELAGTAGAAADVLKQLLAAIEAAAQRGESALRASVIPKSVQNLTVLGLRDLGFSTETDADGVSVHW